MNKKCYFSYKLTHVNRQMKCFIDKIQFKTQTLTLLNGTYA